MRFPGEWEPHERTVMGWPCRAALWGATIDQARADYATVANTIAAFEPVTMIAGSAADAAAARAACAAAVEIVELPLDDSWLRDSGPIWLLQDTDAGERPWVGSRVAVHFRFNAWGEKFAPWDRDATVGRLIAEHLGDPVLEAPMVLEGGSVLSDGAGTLLSTEQCLLHPNRNPGMSAAEIESSLLAFLEAERVVWLGQGLVEDRDTDGHVDLIASVTPERRVLLQTVPEDNVNFAGCEENRARLAAAGLEVIELPFLPYIEVAGERVVASYLNLYVCNGAVVVPVCGTPTDQEALAIIGSSFPGREVVPVPGAVIAFGGGGPHCITQQVPAVPADPGQRT